MTEFKKIRDNVLRLVSEIPPEVSVIAATKGRRVDEILAALDAGIKIIGENYVQEAEEKRPRLSIDIEISSLPSFPQWHFIGHLQPNKIKRALALFDMIETIDSPDLARAIDEHAALAGVIIPVLIEVNSGREPQKNGVLPEATEELARFITGLPSLKLQGLMTMGPDIEAEALRPYFAETRRLFEKLQQEALAEAEIKYLSMGMSQSYMVAIDEGANMVRLGTAIFGPRP